MCACCQVISVGQDEALSCSDHCQQWVCHYCVSVSVKDIEESDAPFLAMKERASEK